MWRRSPACLPAVPPLFLLLTYCTAPCLPVPQALVVLVLQMVRWCPADVASALDRALRRRSLFNSRLAEHVNRLNRLNHAPTAAASVGLPPSSSVAASRAPTPTPAASLSLDAFTAHAGAPGHHQQHAPRSPVAAARAPSALPGGAIAPANSLVDGAAMHLPADASAAAAPSPEPHAVLLGVQEAHRAMRACTLDLLVAYAGASASDAPSRGSASQVPPVPPTAPVPPTGGSMRTSHAHARNVAHSSLLQCLASELLRSTNAASAAPGVPWRATLEGGRGLAACFQHPLLHGDATRPHVGSRGASGYGGGPREEAATAEECQSLLRSLLDVGQWATAAGGSGMSAAAATQGWHPPKPPAASAGAAPTTPTGAAAASPSPRHRRLSDESSLMTAGGGLSRAGSFGGGALTISEVGLQPGGASPSAASMVVRHQNPAFGMHSPSPSTLSDLFWGESEVDGGAGGIGSELVSPASGAPMGPGPALAIAAAASRAAAIAVAAAAAAAPAASVAARQAPGASSPASPLPFEAFLRTPESWHGGAGPGGAAQPGPTSAARPASELLGDGGHDFEWKLAAAATAGPAAPQTSLDGSGRSPVLEAAALLPPVAPPPPPRASVLGHEADGEPTTLSYMLDPSVMAAIRSAVHEAHSADANDAEAGEGTAASPAATASPGGAEANASGGATTNGRLTAWASLTDGAAHALGGGAAADNAAAGPQSGSGPAPPPHRPAVHMAPPPQGSGTAALAAVAAMLTGPPRLDSSARRASATGQPHETQPRGSFFNVPSQHAPHATPPADSGSAAATRARAGSLGKPPPAGRPYAGRSTLLHDGDDDDGRGRAALALGGAGAAGSRSAHQQPHQPHAGRQARGSSSSNTSAGPATEGLGEEFFR